MPPAVIAAGVGAAGAIGGAALSSSAQKKAANTAAAAADRTAELNNALARDIYGQNRNALSPFMTRGNQAGDALMELLGFAPQPANTNTPAMAPGNALSGFAGGGGAFSTGTSGRQFLPRQAIINESDFLNPGGIPTSNMGQPQVTNALSGTVPAGQGAQSAFDRYRASTGYDFRMGEGFKGLNTAAGAQGLLESGAAKKALVRYGQDYGSNEFGKYLGYLTGQQGVGLAGASALAGVGQNYAGLVTSNNSAAGDAAANAALLRGNANGQLYGGIANALGGFAGSFGSSYQPTLQQDVQQLIMRNPGVF